MTRHLLLAALVLAVTGCTDDFNASTSCEVLAAKLDAPATLEPDAPAVFTLTFSSPVGTRYRLDWTATRGTLTPRDKVSTGAGGASGSPGGQAGVSGSSGQSAAGDGGQAGALAGASGSSGQSASGQSGSVGAAGADDGAADPVSVADYVAPDAPGSVTVTALLSRLSGSDSEGPAACPIIADIAVGAAGAGGGGAAGAGGGGASGQMLGGALGAMTPPPGPLPLRRRERGS